MARLRPRDVDFVAGAEMRLRCTARGSPPATITWRRRGRSLIFNSGRVGMVYSLISQLSMSREQR